MIDCGTMTPDMTRDEKRAIVLSALIRFPNPDIIAGYVGCGKTFARQVGDEYGIDHVFVEEAKYDMIKARLEKNISPQKIFAEVAVHLNTVYRVKNHLEWYGDTIRMLAAADRNWKNVDGIRAEKPEPLSTTSKTKSAEAKKPARRNFQRERDALFNLAGVQAARPAAQTAGAASVKRAAAEMGSGPG